MNVDAVLKRLEALEGKLIGTAHIESILIGIPGKDGLPFPCSDPEAYTGEYVVLENRFVKVNRIWVYRPRITRIKNYADYMPPEGFRNAVISLVRQGTVEISEYARKAVEAALQAVKEGDFTTGKPEEENNLKGEKSNEGIHS